MERLVREEARAVTAVKIDGVPIECLDGSRATFLVIEIPDAVPERTFRELFLLAVDELPTGAHEFEISMGSETLAMRASRVSSSGYRDIAHPDRKGFFFEPD
ncbi:MAG TPA: hypothetical protein VGK17_21480 [Propionicimonas sp.]